MDASFDDYAVAYKSEPVCLTLTKICTFGDAWAGAEVLIFRKEDYEGPLAQKDAQIKSQDAQLRNYDAEIQSFRSAAATATGATTGAATRAASASATLLMI